MLLLNKDYMKKILSLLLTTSSIFSMQLDLVNFDQKTNNLEEKFFKYSDSYTTNTNKIHIEPSSVFIPHQLGSVELYHGKKGFYVRQDDKKYVIKKYFTDPIARDLTKEQLKAFLKNGYFSLNQMNDGEFSLKAKGRVVGGGPTLGLVAYWTTKAVCYGVIFAATLGAITGGGKITVGTMSPTPKERAVGAAQELVMEGAKYGAQAGIMYVATTATVPLSVASTTTGAIGSTVVATTGTKIIGSLAGAKLVSTAAFGASAGGTLAVSTAITGAGLAPQAGLVTAAGVASTSGTGLGVAASIELLALKVGLFFGMTPTP